METCDLTIFGGGSSGLFAARIAAEHRLSTQIIEPSPLLGGQPMCLYPDKDITNVPGHVSIKGKQLAQNLIAQAMTCNPTVRLSEQLTTLTPACADFYKLEMDNKTMHLSRSLIICTRSRTRQRKLRFAYDAQLDGSAVFYGAPDRDKFANKRVLVVGGGSSAVEWAGELKGTTTSLLLINRQSRFDAQPALVQRLTDLKVEVKCSCELVAVDKLASSVHYQLRCDGALIDGEADVILACLGSDPDLGFATSLGLQTTSRGIAVGQNMETNRARVYAIGDACDYPYRQRLIVSGFGEAAIAVGSIAQQLRR